MFLKLECYRTLADEMLKLYQMGKDAGAGSLEDRAAEQRRVADVFEHLNDARVQLEVGYISLLSLIPHVFTSVRSWL